ncbi:MAG TPA: hypothetical protein VNG31_09110 [Candidatus Baltobacteraceae bacterium]|nr:hypothetical protein [Candidatus Baltobacteraceae bacterium]
MSHTPANVRISQQAHILLRQLADEEDVSMQTLLDRALESYRRDRFLQAANADYAALRERTAAWKEVTDERRLWESTDFDGIEK